MRILIRAPFLVVLTGLVVSLAASDRIAAWAVPPVALTVACGTMLISWNTVVREQSRVAALAIVVTLCCSSWVAFSLGHRSNASLPSRVQAVGTVVESRPWGRFHVVAVKTEQGGFVLKLPFAEAVEGQRVRLEGMPKPFAGKRAGNDFREDRYWYARGMTAWMTSSRIEILSRRDWNIHRWRYVLYRSLILHMPRLTGAYLNAAWTGKRDGELNEKHKLSGTSHLLAVSGFHTGVLMLGVSLIFRRGKGRVPCLSLFLWFYVLSTGASSSSVRAGAMIQTALLGELAGRPGSAINSVSLAATALLLHSPFQFWDISWRLSVSAALMIAALMEQGVSDRQEKPSFGKSLAFSPLIWAATYPQVAWTFGAVPVVGVFVNFFAPAFFGAVFSTASVAAALHLAGVPGMGLLLRGIEGIFVLWESVTDAFVCLIPWQLPWNPFFVHACTVISIAILCRALLMPWRSVALLAPLGSLAAFLLFAA